MIFVYFSTNADYDKQAVDRFRAEVLVPARPRREFCLTPLPRVCLEKVPYLEPPRTTTSWGRPLTLKLADPLILDHQPIVAAETATTTV